MGLDNFYYNLLHIHQTTMNEHQMISLIDHIVKEQMHILKEHSSSLEGMCKVASYQIAEQLKQNNIAVEYVNTKQLLGSYEHVALMATYQIREQIHYILIDPTYIQFVPRQNETLNPIFLEWPGKYLKEHNQCLYDHLTELGYAKINQHDWTDYLDSFLNFHQKNEIPIETIWGIPPKRR